MGYSEDWVVKTGAIAGFTILVILCIIAVGAFYLLRFIFGLF